jgi:ABC-type transporter Mla MlaB component
VNCWIGVVQEDDRCLVRLAGQLRDAQVPELFLACETCKPRVEGSALQLDLTELVSADAAGIDALQRVRDRGATLVGASGYIQLKLDAHV